MMRDVSLGKSREFGEEKITKIQEFHVRRLDLTYITGLLIRVFFIGRSRAFRLREAARDPSIC